MTTRTLQDLFVDRLTQLERFRKSLEGDSPRRIIIITAPPGMGKSWLVKQFMYEATSAGALTVLLDFADTQAYDALMLVRRFRDALGAVHFNALTHAINEATSARVVIDGGSTDPANVNISLGTNNTIGSVEIGDVAGGNIIKDNLFIIQTDNPLLLQAVEDRITTVFFEGLTALAQRSKIVFFFDSYERNSLDADRWVPTAADRWITRELLGRIRDGKLPNALAVLAGRRAPDFGVEWNSVLGRMQLEAFVLEDVAQYLRENRGLSNLTDADVQTLFNAVQGNPQLMGIIGDNLEQATRPAADEEW